MQMNVFRREKVLAFITFSKKPVSPKFRNPYLEGQVELRK